MEGSRGETQANRQDSRSQTARKRRQSWRLCAIQGRLRQRPWIAPRCACPRRRRGQIEAVNPSSARSGSGARTGRPVRPSRLALSRGSRWRRAPHNANCLAVTAATLVATAQRCPAQARPVGVRATGSRRAVAEGREGDDAPRAAAPAASRRPCRATYPRLRRLTRHGCGRRVEALVDGRRNPSTVLVSGGVEGCGEVAAAVDLELAVCPA